MDLDVEAMLEAPFREKQNDEPTESHSRHEERSPHYEHRGHSPSRSHRSYSRHRSHHRSPSYERHRSHSRSHRDDRYRDDRRYRSRERRRHRSRSPRRRSRTPDRYSRRHGHRDRSYSPPVPPEERDRRTVFVTQLAQRLKNREFHDFFSQAGRVRDARIISDRNTRRSKGVGYVEFYDESSVPTALAMSGQKLLGIPVNVQLTEAEKNRQALQAQLEEQQAAQNGTNVSTVNAIQPVQKPPTHDIMDQRLYVGSVNYTLTDHDLRQVFEPYGPIDFVDLHKDNLTGRSKGFAFIQFRHVKDAKEALSKMNGFELAGRNLKVGMVTERAQSNNYSSGGLDSGPLDDDSGSMGLNSLSRAELMKKLAARESELMPTAEKVTQPPVNVIPVPVVTPSRTLMLTNMFNPAEETEPDWVQELSVDIKEECQQYGSVEHIFVDPDSLGEVFLKFDSVIAGQKAFQSLNGRWFGGRQIRASYMVEDEYNRRFSK
ncbi:RNA binding motif protein 39b [Halteromyces radiatus]|uniref:RNA binding motif protein 39b n=1 Tax=Halteromyces radiatus TaxID=101107 RepID=UPI00221EB107|nr:RNA binding motif protein 39b [Halteromyces radiatus]KAI8093274.1 RNA binding motif protein 39b [Halteromyces radiatus]